jgi:hypothetical protein
MPKFELFPYSLKGLFFFVSIKGFELAVSDISLVIIMLFGFFEY